MVLSYSRAHFFWLTCLSIVVAVASAGSGQVQHAALKEDKAGVSGESNVQTFTALTKPLPLFPGEVTNTWHHIDIPPGPIAISEFSADIVEKDPATGELIPVPLSDAYLHHHVVFSSHKHYEHQKHWWSPMKPESSNANRGVGFGAGTESRGTRQRFPFPYRFTTVQGEDELVANVHVINTRNMSLDQAHHCLECPCTTEDRVALAVEDDDDDNNNNKKKTKKKGGLFHSWGHHATKAETPVPARHKGNSTLLETVIKRRTNWTRCNTHLMDESNTACSPQSYYGGLICCEHGEFCLDDYFMTKQQITKSDNATQSVFYLRYTLSYTPMEPEIEPLYLAACCDASGNLTSPGNIEYDIPKLCDDPSDDNDACVHTLETIQMLHGASTGGFGIGGADNEEDIYVDVVDMVGHLHRGGISLTASFASNNSVICQSLPTYGTGEAGEIGNEPGYINSMSTCTFDPPLRMKTTEQIRVVGKYNATTAHTGVMSLFYIAIADVPRENTGSSKRGGFWKHFQPLAILVAACIVIGATWKFTSQYGFSTVHRRSGYEEVPGGNVQSFSV